MNTPAAVFGQSISFPPRVGADGRIAWSQGEDNIRESIRVILMTGFGERLRLPEFGGDLGSFLFEPNNPATGHLMADRIQNALTLWEPRVVVEAVQVDQDPADPEAAIATISYKLVATQARERVTLNVSLSS
jgi:phage baseplate assembly protein W